MNSCWRVLVVAMAACSLPTHILADTLRQAQMPPYPDSAKGPGFTRRSRGSDPFDKLTPELRLLVRQYARTRGGRAKGEGFSEKELRERFGIQSGEARPAIEVVITTTGPYDREALRQAGAGILFVSDRMVYAMAPVLRLQQIARLRFVSAIAPVAAVRIPRPLDTRRQPAITVGRLSRGENAPGAFDAQGLTGKGVLIGIIDTGIDWRHPDFIRPDGSSRILYLWDAYDDSWEKSGGKTGTKPPQDDPRTGKPLGTLYTREQITKALQGQGEVNSKDEVGHGTACAGTAAGNGRATANDVPAGTYMGVAPEADLIVVKIAAPLKRSPADPRGEQDPHAGEANGRYGLVGALWAINKARELNRPIVVSLSFGHQFSAHDGSAPEEELLDEAIGAGKPGGAVCVSAGNEGRDSFHAAGVFGPRRPEQQDIESEPVELFVTKETTLTAYFDHRDDWGLVISGLEKFLVDEKGKPVHLLLSLRDGGIEARMSAQPQSPADLRQFVEESVEAESPMSEGGKTDCLIVQLPPGHYALRGFANSEKVASGRFDLYLPDTETASFGHGTTADCMVGAPGNAGHVITVGSYDFRGEWLNRDGKRTAYNLRPGELSYFTSPGFRRDGVVKPDITAPGRFMISSMARDSVLARETGASHITQDGLHLAWQGTSASAPYVAGVVALMFEKDPKLDADRIRQILVQTAAHDPFTGAVPNPQWGHGKIDPAAALRLLSR